MSSMAYAFAVCVISADGPMSEDPTEDRADCDHDNESDGHEKNQIRAARRKRG